MSSFLLFTHYSCGPVSSVSPSLMAVPWPLLLLLSLLQASLQLNTLLGSCVWSPCPLLWPHSHLCRKPWFLFMGSTGQSRVPHSRLFLLGCPLRQWALGAVCATNFTRDTIRGLGLWLSGSAFEAFVSVPNTTKLKVKLRKMESSTSSVALATF